MARNIVRRSVRGGSGRKLSIWLGASSISPQTLTISLFVAVELVSNASLTAVGFQGHIARTRGFVGATPGTLNQDPLVAWGVGVFDVGLTVASQFPDPLLEPRDPYFAWGLVFAGAPALLEMDAGNVMRIDSKGKRRYNDSDRVMLILREVGSGHTAVAYFDVDVLVIPDQGA